MSCVDPERKRFNVTESVYHVWLTKQEVLKFRCLYVMCGSHKKVLKLRSLCITCGSPNYLKS